MGITLGINDDYWHGIIACAVTIIIGIVCLLSTLPQKATVHTIWISFFLVSWLQAINESFQANDFKLIQKYGSLVNFQFNSRRDWKYTLFGWLGGMVISVIIMLIFFN